MFISLVISVGITLSNFSFQSVLLHWYNKCCGMYCESVHIKEPMLLIGKRSPYSYGSGFPQSLFDLSVFI